jgi:hypothetical protein
MRVLRKLVDEHPVLIGTVILTGAGLLLPGGWLIRQILTLFGFGLQGIVAGVAHFLLSPCRVFVTGTLAPRIRCRLGTRRILGCECHCRKLVCHTASCRNGDLTPSYVRLEDSWRNLGGLNRDGDSRMNLVQSIMLD